MSVVLCSFRRHQKDIKNAISVFLVRFKNAFVSVQQNDTLIFYNKCFSFEITIHIHPEDKNGQFPKNIKQQKLFNIDNMKCFLDHHTQITFFIYIHIEKS